MHYRIGQILTLILVIIALAGFFVSLFFPWYTIGISSQQNAARVTDACMVNMYQQFWVRSYFCDGCSNAVSACGSGNDWRTDCLSTTDPFAQGSNKCMREYYIWQSSFGLTICAAIFLALAVVSYILHMINCWRSAFAYGAAGFALLIAVIVLILFSVGHPIAVQTDNNEASGQSWDAKCAGGPCLVFIGNRNLNASAPAKYPGTTVTTGTQKWGPGLGWIINLCSSIFLLIVVIVFGVIGRGGDRWVRTPSHMV